MQHRDNHHQSSSNNYYSNNNQQHHCDQGYSLPDQQSRRNTENFQNQNVDKHAKRSLRGSLSPSRKSVKIFEQSTDEQIPQYQQGSAQKQQFQVQDDQFHQQNKEDKKDNYTTPNKINQYQNPPKASTSRNTPLYDQNYHKKQEKIPNAVYYDDKHGQNDPKLKDKEKEKLFTSNHDFYEPPKPKPSIFEQNEYGETKMRNSLSQYDNISSKKSSGQIENQQYQHPPKMSSARQAENIKPPSQKMSNSPIFNDQNQHYRKQSSGEVQNYRVSGNAQRSSLEGKRKISDHQTGKEKKWIPIEESQQYVTRQSGQIPIQIHAQQSSQNLNKSGQFQQIMEKDYSRNKQSNNQHDGGFQDQENTVSHLSLANKTLRDELARYKNQQLDNELLIEKKQQQLYIDIQNTQSLCEPIMRALNEQNQSLKSSIQKFQSNIDGHAQKQAQDMDKYKGDYAGMVSQIIRGNEQLQQQLHEQSIIIEKQKNQIDSLSRGGGSSHLSINRPSSVQNAQNVQYIQPQVDQNSFRKSNKPPQNQDSYKSSEHQAIDVQQAPKKLQSVSQKHDIRSSNYENILTQNKSPGKVQSLNLHSPRESQNPNIQNNMQYAQSTYQGQASNYDTSRLMNNQNNSQKFYPGNQQYVQGHQYNEQFDEQHQSRLSMESNRSLRELQGQKYYNVDYSTSKLSGSMKHQSLFK